ncbi:hypothetical protein E2C01_087820 [Portunus trituberculatus]|uniref:Uncharacterized protein n=1 Tax=Portunus trituberculatus TaxID=210409 RepID=A0A5B7JKD3_PORTR|nr:hypothetical protein [Portunus trituberculatus]
MVLSVMVKEAGSPCRYCPFLSPKQSSTGVVSAAAWAVCTERWQHELARDTGERAQAVTEHSLGGQVVSGSQSLRQVGPTHKQAQEGCSPTRA